MLKLKFLFLFVLTLALMATVVNGTVLAASETLTAQVDVASPTAVYLKLVAWDQNSSIIKKDEINFSEGATAGKIWPGKTSWDDSVGGGADDGFISKPENVGFNLIAVGPAGSNLNIKCGKMSDISGNEIPYQSADGNNAYFGFSACTVPDLTFIVGTSNSMQPHSLAGWNYVFPAGHYGYELWVYNMLKIPASAVVGNYSTVKGDANHAPLLITLAS